MLKGTSRVMDICAADAEVPARGELVVGEEVDDPDELGDAEVGVGDGVEIVGVGDALVGDGVGLADFDGDGCVIELGFDDGAAEELTVDGAGAGALPLVLVGLGTGKTPWLGWPGNSDEIGRAPWWPRAWPRGEPAALRE